MVEIDKTGNAEKRERKKKCEILILFAKNLTKCNKESIRAPFYIN